jgi:hypothetical protein
MATQTINYGATTQITMNLSGLASSATWVAGRESNEIDNTTNKFVDALVQGSISVGTSPTANTVINVFVYGSDTSLTTSPIDVFDGVDSAETIASGAGSATGILYSMFRLGAAINVLSTTSDAAYPVAPFSIAQLFGGVMPKYWGLYVAHNTGQNLRADAVNTNSFDFVGIKYDVA